MGTNQFWAWSGQLCHAAVGSNLGRARLELGRSPLGISLVVAAVALGYVGSWVIGRWAATDPPRTRVIASADSFAVPVSLLSVVATLTLFENEARHSARSRLQWRSLPSRGIGRA